MTNFVFNSKTGTMDVANRPSTVSPTMEQAISKQPVITDEEEDEPVEESKQVSDGVSIVPKTEQPNISTDNEAEIVFKKFSDFSVVRIDDQATGKWLVYFAGYALDIQFNMDELKGAHASRKIEAALEGLTKMFRKIIMDQAVGG